MNTQQKGRLGEDFASDCYKKWGYKIIERNYHTRYGEIDIIAENDSEIIFVEVKARNGKGSTPRDAVDYSKQKRIVLTAIAYMQKTDSEKNPRFDVFEVWHNESRVFKFNLINDAFDASCCEECL